MEKVTIIAANNESKSGRGKTIDKAIYNTLRRMPSMGGCVTGWAHLGKIDDRRLKINADSLSSTPVHMIVVVG